MENEGIDYNIVFPHEETTETHWQGTKEPVVILLGWAGCKDKHLTKYSSIYTDQGCVTIRYTAPLKTVFISESFGYKELRCTALKLLEILYDYEVEQSPIFFHIFSNGGFMLYRYIVELLHKDKQFSSLCVIGAIVDSAPGSGNVLGAVRALAATLGPKISPLLKYVLLTLFAVTVFLLRVVLYPLTKYVHKNHYDAVQEEPPAWPHFFLYSSADQVIRPRDVRVFADTLKFKGVRVDSHDFVSSGHVSHLREYPEQYPRKCRNFLITCMKDTKGAHAKTRHRVQDQ
ncbi:transmembrane protein 53 [Corythoichthys intestinalis]|uniref:transmembrane protein 53 n=1 Tax=Corythoichthys intestinalis TaxID=161448 RepID=UPI0025A581EC|nr:transmembrane protein 53 [Corythoichthys intestinalis]XP_061795889.1 transmembrane protein 53 [Nerophis lumbriciformis]